MKDKIKKTKIGFGFIKLFLKESFFVSLYVSIMLAMLGTGIFFYLMVKTEPASSLFTRNIAQTSIIYDRTGQHTLYEIHGEENRKILAHEEIPDVMRVTAIATEDNNFYIHQGIDPKAIMRALKTNFENGQILQGGSTITQQLARNAFLTREKTLNRKVLEAVYAIKIERHFSKEQILDAYLNEVPYGSNAYGIEAAAETYFDKKASELTLDEAALLSAMTKAPSYYSPYGNNREALERRQRDVLKKTAELRLADPAMIEEALKINTLEKVIPLNQPIQAPHFVFYVKGEIEKKYGKEILEEGGLKIYTSLDYEKQKLAEKIIRESEPSLKNYRASNAALVAIDPKNGQILAMVGSKNYFDKSIDGEVNVTMRPRQPGSSFKPFAYAKAFEKGFQPETMVLDAQTNFGPDGSGRNYVPRNYDGRFHGVISMREALAMSLNVPAVKTLQIVGIDETIELAHRLGITTLKDRQRYGLSLVIGGGEVTLLDETSGFSVFANDGKRNPADPILKIVDPDGRTIRENTPKNLPVLDPQVARKINSILSDNKARSKIFGPNNKLHIPGRVVAAKTGTTQEFRDAWTVGYSPSLATGVWVGNNNNFPMRAGADGSFVAAPIWNRFMAEALKDYPEESFIPYESRGKENRPEEKVPFESPLVPQIAGAQSETKITYYKKSSGKKISEEKARKMDPDKIRMKVEIVTPDGKKEKFSSSAKPEF